MYSIHDIDNFDIKTIQKLHKEYVNPNSGKIISLLSYGKEIFVSAEGMFLKTKSNKKILDFTGGLGVLNHGHNHPRILKARIDFQKNKKLEVHKVIFSPYLVALSHNISKLLNGKLKYSFFCNSGAESVEGAMKIAHKKYNGKRKFILHSNISYHGKLIASGSISNQNSKFFPKINNTKKFVYNNIESIKEIVKELKNQNGESDIYAIIVETMNASSIRKLSYEFLKELREICDKENIVLIFDEIYTGWFKCLKLFHFMNYDNIFPDIITTSKALGGGKSSISAYLVKEKIYNESYGSSKDAFLHTSTYNGFGEECYTAIEAIQICYDEKFGEKSLNNFKYIKNKLENLEKKYPHYIAETLSEDGLNGLIFRYSFINNNLKINNIENLLNKLEIIKKIIAVAISNELFEKYNILTSFNEKSYNENNKNFYQIIFLTSPSLIADRNDIDYFFNSLEKILKSNLESLIIKFIKSNLKMIFS